MFRAQDPAAAIFRAQGPSTAMPRAQDPAILRTQDPSTVMPRAQGPTTMPRTHDPAIDIPRVQDAAIAILRTQDTSTVMPRAQDPTTPMPRAQDPDTAMTRSQDSASAMPTAQDPITAMHRAQDPSTAMPRARDPTITNLRAQDPSTAVPRAQDPSNLSNYPPPFVFLGPRHPTIFYPKKLMFRAPGEMPLRFPPGVLLPNSTQQSQFYNSRQLRPSRHQQPLRPNPQQPTRPSNPQQPQNPTTLQQAPRLSNLQQASRFSNPQLSRYLPNPGRSRHQRPTSAPSHQQLTSFQNPMLRPLPVPHQRNLQSAHQGQLQATQYHLNMSNSPQNYLTQMPIDISDRNSLNSKPTGIKEELGGMRNVASEDVNSSSPVPVIRRILPPPMLNNPSLSENSKDIVAMSMNQHMEINELELSENKDGEQFHLIKTGQELARMCFAVEVGCQTDLSFPLDKEIVVMPVEALGDLITAPEDDKPKIEQIVVPGSNNIARPGDSVAEDSNKAILEENAFQDQEIVQRERLMKDNPDLTTDIDLIKEKHFVENKIKDDNNQMLRDEQTNVEVPGNLSLTLNSQKVQLPFENLNRDKSLEEILDTDNINTDSKLSKVKSENNDLKIIEDFKGEPKAASRNIDTCPGPDVEEKASSFNPLSNFLTLMSYTDPYIKAHLSDIRFDASTSSATQVVGQRSSENAHFPEKDQLAIPIPQIYSQSFHKNMTDHANIEKPACVDNFPVKSIETGEQSRNTAKSSYASTIICRNPKYKDANSENSSNSSDLNPRLMNKNLIESSNTTGDFLTDYEDPQPSTSKKLCQGGFTKSQLKSPLDKLKPKENFGNPKPDVATRMSFDQFKELTEGNVSSKQRSRNESQGISKTWNLSLLDALSATERRDCIPGITSLKKDNIQNESIQLKLFKDSENASPVKIEKESVINNTVKASPVNIETEILIKDTVKASPVNIEKKILIKDTVKASPVNIENKILIKGTVEASPVNIEKEILIKDTVKGSPVNIEKKIFIKDTVKASPVNIDKEILIKDTVKASPVYIEKEILIKDTEKTSLASIEKERMIKDTVEISPIRIEKESVVRDTEKNSPIWNEKESMMKPGIEKDTMIKDTVDTSPLKAEEAWIKDTENASRLGFQNESMIKDTVETSPLKVKERLIKDTKNASPLGFPDETMIKDTVETSPLKVEERMIKDTENASPLGFQNESMIKDTVETSPLKLEERLMKDTENASPLGLQNESMIKDTVETSPLKVKERLIKDSENISPICFQNKSMIKDTVKTSPVKIQKECVIINTATNKQNLINTSPIQIIKEPVSSPIAIQKESVIKDTVQTSRKEYPNHNIIKNTEQNKCPIHIQRISVIRDTFKTSPVRIQRESLIKVIVKTSPVRIQKESVHENTDNASTVRIQKEGIIEGTENENECVIKISGDKKIHEKRSSRGRILKKRTFDDYDDCSTDSDDDEEGNSSNIKCQNLCSSKIAENKVILSTRKSNGLDQHSQKNDVKNIGSTVLQKSPMIISIIHPANDVSRNLRDVELQKRVIIDLEDYKPTEDDENISVKGIPKIKSRNPTKVNTVTVNEKSLCERGDRVLRSASKVNFQFIPAEHKKTKEIKEATGKRKGKLPIHDHKKLGQDEVKGSKRKSKVTKQLQKVFDEVMKDSASADFYYNVNEPRPMPRYYIIENLEIDLKSVELKLENDLYTDVEEFLQDFRNIAKTSVDYFGPIHKISKKSGKLLDLACGLVSRRNLSLHTGSNSDLIETLNTDSNKKIGNPIGKSTKRKTEEVTETTSKKNRNDCAGFVCEECGTMFAYSKGYNRHSKSKSACVNAIKKVAGHPKAFVEMTDHQTETRDISKRSHSTALGVATLFDSESLNQTSKDIKKKMKLASEDCRQISMKTALDNHIEEERPKFGELFGREKSNGEDNENVSSHDASSFSRTPPSPSAASSLKPLSRRKSLPKKNCGFVPLFPRGVPVSHPQDNIVIDADDDNFEPPGLLVRSLVDAIANTTLPLN